jgi:crotonobetainyl-CoA:carnitine CoA-transferase CaiB-like acyl-CoA transferase
MDHPDLGRIKIVGSPIGLSETPVTVSGPPPELGANTEEILLDAGYSWEDVEALRDKGAT